MSGTSINCTLLAESWLTLGLEAWAPFRTTKSDGLSRRRLPGTVTTTPTCG